MKKIEKIIPAVMVLLSIAGSFLFSSCDEVEEEEPKKPDIEIQENGISISFALDSNAKYINIFRKEILPSTATEEEIKANVELNIGEFIPKETATINSYTFTDTFLKSNTKYTYSVRYKHEKGFVYTGWSDWPVDSEEEDKTPPTTAYTTNSHLKFSKPENAYFEYSESTKCLFYKGDNLLEVAAFAGFEPCLCVSYTGSSGSVKRVFSIKDYCVKDETVEVDEDDDGVADATRSILLKADSKIDLRSLLTLDFFDKDIYIDGILYQQTDSTKKSYDKITWSQLCAVTVKAENEAGELEEIKTLKIEYNVNKDDSHDFSNYSGTRRL